MHQDVMNMRATELALYQYTCSEPGRSCIIALIRQSPDLVLRIKAGEQMLELILDEEGNVTFTDETTDFTDPVKQLLPEADLIEAINTIAQLTNQQPYREV